MFAEYIQSLTQWLYQNPHWALFFTFLISFSESLAIVGSIVPGTVTMTAIGILAGSGVMRIDLTLIAAILGAIAGDGASYFIGYWYKHQLTNWWLFRKYPHWLEYGEQYFHRHGGKSVFIGRFTGPLRSIIPLVAGMMGMNQWRFLSANITSAIGWSFLYVVPGILIGTASHDLSPESATRLFITILLLLAAIWLTGIILKWLYIRLNYFLRLNLHDLWRWSHRHAFFRGLIRKITPNHERHYYQTAMLFLCFLLSMILLIVMLTGLMLNSFNQIDESFWLLMQSIRLSVLDNIFVYINALTALPVIVGFLICLVAWLSWHGHGKTAAGLLALVIFNLSFNFLIGLLIQIPRPDGVLLPLDGSAFPNESLSLMTSLIAFLLFFTFDRFSPFFISLVRRLLVISLLISAFSHLYLGDNWLSVNIIALLSGIFCSALFWLMMRTDLMSAENHNQYLTFSTIGLVLFMLLMNAVDFRESKHEHSLIYKVDQLNQAQWWEQTKPILPLYRLNRLGDPLSLLNIQYKGTLQELQKSLEQHGWQTEQTTPWRRLLQRFSQGDSQTTLPLLNQLYQNQKPKLVMSYMNENKKITYVIRFWNSRYVFNDSDDTLWIGSVHRHHYKKLIKVMNQNKTVDPLTYLLPALNNFLVRRLEIPEQDIVHLPYQSKPYIVLIKKNSHD